MAATHEKLLARSFRLIEERPDITNREVPSYLLRFWKLKRNTRSIEQSAGYIVFRHALQLYYQDRNKAQEPEGEALWDLFGVFQFIVRFTDEGKLLPVNIRSIRLFDFDHYDENVLYLLGFDGIPASYRSHSPLPS